MSLTKKPVGFPRRLLSLDTGRKTGWCVSEEGKILNYGLVELYKSGGDHCESAPLFKLQSWLIAFRQSSGIDAVAFEQIGGGTKGAQTKYVNMYRAVIVLFGEHSNIPVVGIAPATIKKAVTGSGRADKKEMIDAIRERGYLPEDDNVADAIGCAISFWDNLDKGIYNAPTNRTERPKRRRKKPSV